VTAPHDRARITAEDIPHSAVKTYFSSEGCPETIAAVLNDPAIRRLVVRKCIDGVAKVERDQWPETTWTEVLRQLCGPEETPRTDLPALERAVEEARREMARHIKTWTVRIRTEPVPSHNDLAPLDMDDAFTSLIRAARLAERARCREAVIMNSMADMRKVLAAIDALPDTPPAHP
jgi:hypothetical protein